MQRPGKHSSMIDFFKDWTPEQIEDYMVRRLPYMIRIERGAAIYELALHGRDDLIEKFRDKCISATTTKELSNTDLNEIVFGTCAGGHMDLVKKYCAIADSHGIVLQYHVAFCFACKGGNHDIIFNMLERTKLLLEFSQEVVDYENPKLYSFNFEKGISELCKRGDEVVLDVLKNIDHVDINSQYNIMDDVIYNACFAGNLIIVKALLGYATEQDKTHPLNITRGCCGAIAGNQIDIYNFLRQIQNTNIDIDKCFGVACEYQRNEMIHAMMTQTRILRPDHGIEGACIGGHLDILQHLIELGAKKYTNFENGFLAACEFGWCDIVTFLMDHMEHIAPKILYKNTLEFGIKIAASNNYQTILKLIAKKHWTHVCVKEALNSALHNNNEGLVYALLKVQNSNDRLIPKKISYYGIDLSKWVVVCRQIHKNVKGGGFQVYCANRFHLRMPHDDNDIQVKLFNLADRFVCKDLSKMFVAFLGAQ